MPIRKQSTWAADRGEASPDKDEVQVALSLQPFERGVHCPDGHVTLRLRLDFAADGHSGPLLAQPDHVQKYGLLELSEEVPYTCASLIGEMHYKMEIADGWDGEAAKIFHRTCAELLSQRRFEDSAPGGAAGATRRNDPPLGGWQWPR